MFHQKPKAIDNTETLENVISAYRLKQQDAQNQENLDAEEKNIDNTETLENKDSEHAESNA